jgi:hypothetical protein
LSRKVEVQIVGDARSLERAFGRAQTRSTAFGSALHKLGRMAIYAGAALAAGLTVELVKSVHAAIDAEASQARLTQAFKDAGVALKPHLAGLERVESASRKLGFTDIEVRDSLGSLIVASHDYRKAIVDLGVAQDLSRFKHVGLTDATKMLTMAMTGSQRAAKQLGIVVIPTTAHVDALKRAHVDLTTALGKSELAHAKLQDKMALGQAVIDQVTKKTSGQAEVFSKTAAGALQRFRAQWEHIQVQLGNFFLPTLARVADGFSRVFDWIGKIAKAPSLKVGLQFAGQGLKDVGTRIKTSIQTAISGTNWSDIGQQLSAAIGAGLVFTDVQVGHALSSLLGFMNSHAQEFAAVGANIAVRLVSTLFDPTFWVHHLDLVLVLLTARFGGEFVGALGRIGARAGARLAEGILIRFAGFAAALVIRLGPAINAVERVFSRVPGLIYKPFLAGGRLAESAIAHVVKSLTSDLRGALAKVPGWLSAAFKVGAVVALWGAIQTAVNKVKNLLSWLKRLVEHAWNVVIHVHVAVPFSPGGGKRIAPGKGGFTLPPPAAAGAFVPGPVGTPVPILAHAGEIILNPAQQQMLGGPRYLSQLFGFHREHGPGSSMAVGGKVGKKHHRAPRLPASIREAEARAAGTYGLADDIAAYTREERWVDQQLHRHDLTGSERESLRVRRIRVVNRLKSLRRRQAQRRKAPTIDYSQIPARILYKIAKARESGDLYALRAALTEAIYYLKGRLSFIPKLTFAQKTALYDALTSYEQELKDVNDQIAGGGDTGTTADQQAIIDQLRAQLGVAQGSAALANAFVSTGVFAGSGPGGSSAPGADGGGNGTTIIFQSVVPATEEQAQQVAALTAQGGAGQPYRTSSQAPTGY